MGSGEWRVSSHERCDNISDGPDPEPEADHSPSPLWQVATYNVCFDEQHQRERFKALCCLLCDEVLRFSYFEASTISFESSNRDNHLLSDGRYNYLIYLIVFFIIKVFYLGT